MPSELVQGLAFAGLRIKTPIKISAPPLVEALSWEFYGSVK